MMPPGVIIGAWLADENIQDVLSAIQSCKGNVEYSMASVRSINALERAYRNGDSVETALKEAYDAIGYQLVLAGGDNHG